MNHSIFCGCKSRLCLIDFFSRSHKHAKEKRLGGKNRARVIVKSLFCAKLDPDLKIRRSLTNHLPRTEIRPLLRRKKEREDKNEWMRRILEANKHPFSDFFSKMNVIPTANSILRVNNNDENINNSRGHRIPSTLRKKENPRRNSLRISDKGPMKSIFDPPSK